MERGIVLLGDAAHEFVVYKYVELGVGVLLVVGVLIGLFWFFKHVDEM